MHKAFLPGIRVPGARPQLDPNSNPLMPRQETDRKGRPVWIMPKPSGRVRHWISAGARREFMRKYRFDPRTADSVSYLSGRTEEQRKQVHALFIKLTREVPIYHGAAVSLVRSLVAHGKYVRKLKEREGGAFANMPVIKSVLAGLRAATGGKRAAVSLSTGGPNG